MADKVFHQQIADLYRKKYASALVGIPFTAMLAWMFRDLFPASLLFAGLILKFLSVALRLAAGYCYFRFGAWLTSRQWGTLYLFLLAFDGVVWSGLTIFFVPENRPEFIAGTVAIIVGVGAVGTKILSPHFIAHLVFSGSLLLPAAAWHLYQGGHIFSQVSAVALVLFFILIVLDGQRIAADFEARIRLQVDLDESLSALRESEERWRALYEFSPASTYVWEQEGDDWVLVSYNRAAKALTGNRVDGLIGKRASQLYADSPEVLEAFKACRERKNIRQENLHYRLRSSGEERLFHADYVFIPDRYVLVTTEDVTEKTRADTALRDSLREKEMLLSEVHHRVKNNLQVLASLISLQKNLVTDDASKRQLENLGLRVRAMGLLHTKLYRSNDLARVDMQEYLSAIAEQVVSVQFQSAGEVELSVMIDGVHLNMETALPLGLIANEVIVNSLKHAFPGIDAPRISVALHRQGDRYTLEICDNGIGMSQGSGSLNTLGLRLVHVLAKQIKGELHISGTDGVTFRIEFFEQNKEEKRWVS